MVEQKKKIRTRDAYRDTYTMRKIGGGISSSIPKKIIERKARQIGISIEEFIKNYKIEIFYDDFGEVDGAFKFVEEKKRGENE